ncbi:MAG: hypothetical protein C5B45_06215 [Chlamydiae bacterium]|nr:MAG: hypothetical protein C5B45_06215 [Chlamydiota bacterium]
MRKESFKDVSYIRAQDFPYPITCFSGVTSQIVARGILKKLDESETNRWLKRLCQLLKVFEAQP